MEYECLACGKASTDPVDCSWCGTLIIKAAIVTLPQMTSSPGISAPDEAECPVCSLVRPANGTARFCPSCRYDYKLQKRYVAPPTAADPIEVPAAVVSDASPIVIDEVSGISSFALSPVPQETAAIPIVISGTAYDLIVNVDLTMRSPEDPTPADLRERIFPLDYADHLIGRRSDKDKIYPEIILPDTGVSKRHARVSREQDGSLSLMDLGSTNGTILNGMPMTPNIKYPVSGDDDIALGCWTRMKLRSR